MYGFIYARLKRRCSLDESVDALPWAQNIMAARENYGDLYKPALLPARGERAENRWQFAHLLSNRCSFSGPPEFDSSDATRHADSLQINGLLIGNKIS